MFMNVCASNRIVDLEPIQSAVTFLGGGYKSALLASVLMVTTACASLTAVSPDPYVPRFENAAVSAGGAQKADVALAIITPGGDVRVSTPVPVGQMDKLPAALRILAGQNASQSGFTADDIAPSFKTFKSKILREFERIALAKGLTVKAAYESLDVMTYDDKKSLQFAVVPEIRLDLDGVTNCAGSNPFFFIVSGSYSCTREINVGRAFSVSVLEPQSREKLYLKNLNLDSTRTTCQASAEFRSGTEGRTAYTLVQNAMKTACQAAVNRELDNLYAEAVKAFVNYLPSGEEALHLKAQALEIKSKKVY